MDGLERNEMSELYEEATSEFEMSIEEDTQEEETGGMANEAGGQTEDEERCQVDNEEACEMENAEGGQTEEEESSQVFDGEEEDVDENEDAHTFRIVNGQVIEGKRKGLLVIDEGGFVWNINKARINKRDGTRTIYLQCNKKTKEVWLCPATARIMSAPPVLVGPQQIKYCNTLGNKHTHDGDLHECNALKAESNMKTRMLKEGHMTPKEMFVAEQQKV